MTAPGSIIRVVDVETTGFDDPAEMVEIGWTDVGLFANGWQIFGNPQALLVDPGEVPIGFAAMAVHHITPGMVGGALPAADARRLVTIDANFLCAHNAKFEQRFLHGPADDLPWLCTLKGAHAAWPDMQSHSNGAIRYERGLCIGDPRAQPAHRAGPDTWVTAHILLELLQRFSVDRLLEISGRPALLRRISFGLHEGKLFSELPWDYLDWIVNKSKMPQDPSKEDVVHTARAELARRQGEREPAQRGLPGVDGNYGYAHDTRDQQHDDQQREAAQ